MNVLFLAHSYPQFATDPVGSFVLRLAVALREEGIQVRVLAPSGPNLAASDVFEGIRVDRFRYAPGRFETLAYTGAMRTHVRESWSARAALGGLLMAGTTRGLRVARGWPAQVIHAHWWFPGGLAGSVVSALGGVPLVTTLHGSDVRIARSSAVSRRLFAHVLRRSYAVTTVSHWLAEETRRLVPAAHPTIAPMPVAASFFTPRARRVRDRLLFVGKLNDQKGIVPLLRALARMRNKPSLDIVAGIGGGEEPTRRLAAELGIAERVNWFPLLEQPALAELYRNSTALVVPAIDEGLGMTAIESLLCSTPVVAFASGGLTDIVEDGRTGFLVPPGDVDALAVALDRLLDLPDQGASLGATGRAHALARFAPSSVAQRYAAIYRSTFGPARG
ncbi:MAG TPA: glycosyltransferase [Gemmatimonadaceae bacterium]|nr:glycosyltransferase [Gemmatimonadaceae bacterium]